MHNASFESHYISSFFLYAYSRVQTFFSTRYWRIKLVFLSLGLSLAMQVPHYNYLYKYAIAKADKNNVFETFVQQVNAPFAVRSFYPNTHEAKMTFRLTVPLLVKALHIPPVSVFILQFFVGILMYVALIKIIEDITKDRVATVFLTLGLGCTYFGCAYLLDFGPWFDTFSYTFFICLMLPLNAYVLLLLTIAGAFTDERFVLALPIVILWYLCHSYSFKSETTWFVVSKEAFKNNKLIAISTGVICYAVLRLFLAYHFHLSAPNGMVGLESFTLNAGNGYVPLGLLSGMESYWILVVASIILLASLRLYKLMVLVLLAILPCLLTAFLVLDITRSLSYIMPVFLLSLYLLKPHLTKNTIRHLSGAVMLGAVAIPTISLTGAINMTYTIFEAIIIVASLGWDGN